MDFKTLHAKYSDAQSGISANPTEQYFIQGIEANFEHCMQNHLDPFEEGSLDGAHFTADEWSFLYQYIGYA